MSIKQDRCYTRTAEDLRRRLNVKSIDDAKDKVDASVESINKLSREVAGLSASVKSTRQTYVSTINQTFTEEQKTRARNNIGAGNSSFSGSYSDLADRPTSLNSINTTEYNKLLGIEAGAEVNIIETIKVNGIEQTITNKEIDLIISSTGSDIYQYSHSGSSGYIWFKNGYLVQWGRIAVVPSEVNTDTTARLTYTHTYDDVPDIQVTPITATPSMNDVSCGGGTTISLSKQGMNIYLNSQTTKAVNVNWEAKGHKAIPNGE